MNTTKFLQWRPYIIPIAIVFQCGILAGMVVLAMRPLVEGREVRLLVETRDPRDLFRGDYAVLRYEFSSLRLDSIANDLDTATTYRFGDELFLELRQQGNYYRAVGLWRTPPQRGEFLQVRVENHDRIAPTQHRAAGVISLRAGIEEYFANTAVAQRLDSLISARGTNPNIRVVAYVMLTDDGAARIKDVSYTVD